LFGSRDFCVYCLDTSRKLIWKFKTGGFVVDVNAEGKRVYISSHDRNIYCLDIENGKELWKFGTDGIINFIEVFQVRYILALGIAIFTVWIENGRLIWKFHTSLSYPAKLKPPSREFVRTQVVWTPITKEEKKKYVGEEIDIADYGSFSGKYIDIGKSDYLGRKKRGYM
jgi:outer membrane protein assembly factor BamB